MTVHTVSNTDKLYTLIQESKIDLVVIGREFDDCNCYDIAMGVSATKAPPPIFVMMYDNSSDAIYNTTDVMNIKKYVPLTNMNHFKNSICEFLDIHPDPHNPGFPSKHRNPDTKPFNENEMAI